MVLLSAIEKGRGRRTRSNGKVTPFALLHGKRVLTRRRLMETIVVRPLVASFAAVLVVLLQMAPTVAAGQSDSAQPIEITYTKWVRVVDGFFLMEGFTGGDAVGTFAGEVLQAQLSYNKAILRIEAIYEVQAGDRSFVSLIRGGRTTNPGDAILDGVVLAGWRTGAPVHVEFHVIPAPSPTESGTKGAHRGAQPGARSLKPRGHSARQKRMV
jgi:hypothetical protein